jgi:hypothetical protein
VDKGFGIAALVIGILSIFIPVVSIYVGAIALLLASVAALAGDRIFGVAAYLIVAVNVFLLSPITLGAIFSEKSGVLVLLLLIMFAIPVAAFALNVTGKLAIGSNSKAPKPS